MRVLYVYCHPLPESFHAAIHIEALAGLAAAGDGRSAAQARAPAVTAGAPMAARTLCRKAARCAAPAVFMRLSA